VFESGKGIFWNKVNLFGDTSITESRAGLASCMLSSEHGKTLSLGTFSNDLKQGKLLTS
jgi:hypothetical protein